MGKHNYPKNRKPNPNSETQMLLSTVGEKRLYIIWAEFGMYATCEILSKELSWYPSPYTIRYLSNKFNWKRTVTDKNLPIYKGLLAGNTPQGHYKHINFL